MNKLVIFLTLCVVALASSHVHHEATHHVEKTPKYINLGHVEELEEVEVVPEEADYTELYVSIADAVFDFFAKLVRAKVNVAIWLKKAVLNLIINAIVFIQQNQDQVGGYASSFLEVMKVFAGNTHNDVPYPHSEYGSPH